MITDKAFWDLSAKVTALEMLVETLIADGLIEEDDPKAIADRITESAFQAEEKVRLQLGESPLAMKVIETIVSLMDRAVKRAVERKTKDQRRSSPK